MKAYRCHKTVHAAKITGVGPVSVLPDSVTIYTDDGSHELPGSFADKVKIEGEDFGYLVRYADGYYSWSPTKAFEEGYTESTKSPSGIRATVGPYDPRTFNDVQQEQFRQAAQPLIEWMRHEMHPHATVIVTNEHAEVMSGDMRINMPWG